jgi:hypothetical protein
MNGFKSSPLKPTRRSWNLRQRFVLKVSRIRSTTHLNWEPSNYDEANQQKIDDIFRLVAITSRRGVVVEIYPHKHQVPVMTAFDKFACRQTRSVIGTKPHDHCHSPKEPWLIRRQSKAIGIECGALPVFPQHSHDGTTRTSRSRSTLWEYIYTGCTCAMGEDPTYASCVRTLTRRFSTSVLHDL